MAIDMTTVTAITHNNKDVVKIEDSNGNVLWQKIVPPTRNILYYIPQNDSYYYVVDMENKTATEKHPTGSVKFAYGGNNILAFNNDLYVRGTLGSGNAQKITFSGDDITLQDATALFPAYSTASANNCFSIDDGYIYFSNGNSNPSEIYKEASDGTITTMSSTWTNLVAANNTIKYNNKYYGTKASTWTSSNKMYEYSNGDWVESNTWSRSGLPSNGVNMFNAWVWKDRVFFDSNNYHYEYNPNTDTWSSHTWNGGVGSFNGSRVFTDGVDCYMVGGTSTNTKIWKLDDTTDTWSEYWIFSSSIRGDFFINKKGSAQLSQNMRPKLA